MTRETEASSPSEPVSGLRRALDNLLRHHNALAAGRHDNCEFVREARAALAAPAPASETLDGASYHDLFIEAPGIPRTSIFNLPYNLAVHCTRTAGWRLWRDDRLLYSNARYEPTLVGGEYDGPDKWLRLDVKGHVIVDSRAALTRDTPEAGS